MRIALPRKNHGRSQIFLPSALPSAIVNFAT
jgi:hypothetical protein